jgi:hypothetical protein
MSPKPAYDRLQELIKKQWWTNTEGRTNEQGEFATRAFYGTHLLTAQLPGGRSISQEVRWRKGQLNRFELRPT